MKYVFFATTFICFATYLWSVIGVFKNHGERMNLAYRILQLGSVLVWGFGLRAIWLSERETWLYIAGTAVGAFCFAVFWLHAGIVKRGGFTVVMSKDQPQRLVQQGLYGRIRHPFYTIYVLNYLAVGATMGDWPTLALTTGLAICYYKAARFEEAKFLRSPLANEYRAYQARSYMFFPKPGRSPRSESRPRTPPENRS
ncbi:MAG TPA: isoprenylcysteine carboxylmethyltransferase family protein [Bdellovibrionales bacterium]|nr:isoprenylcysteine carboxylmethyltransferase family protein [Bdellovibrionales bacterium]